MEITQKQYFINNIKKINDSIITEEKLIQFNIYHQILIEHKSKINLMSINLYKSIYIKHFFDSALLIKFHDFTKTSSIIDIGTGAGFPGLVLKILYPHLELVLLDSNLKKINFLKTLINKLNLTKVQTIWNRSEKLLNKNFDLVVARAVSPIKTFLNTNYEYLNQNNEIILYKGPNYINELKQATHIIKKYNIWNIKNPIYYDEQLGKRTFCFFKSNKI